MTVVQIGLVDKTGKLDAPLDQAASAALNIQVTRDLPQFWPVTATVVYLSDPHRVPSGVWPVQLVAKLPPGEGGFAVRGRQAQLFDPGRGRIRLHYATLL